MWRRILSLLTRLFADDPVEQKSQSTQASYPYPIITQGGKIGIHSIRPNSCLQFISDLKARGGRFPVVKAVNDMDWLIDVKAIDPEIITVARITSPDEGLQFIEFETDMEQRAEYLFAPILDKLVLNPDLRDAVDYWEICNEPDPPHEPPEILGYTRLAECMIACIEMANDLDLKIALFALNAGTPEWLEMEAMVETGVFALARQHGHIMTLHEGVFWNPEKGWIDPIDLYWGQLIPSSPEVEGAGALCFRYRYLYHLLKERNEVIPLVTSEIVYGGGYAHDGGSPEDTVDRASWYDDLGSEDYFLWAHLPFTLGSTDADGDEWRNRNYEFAYPAIIDYMESVKDRDNAADPPPTGPIFQAFLPIATYNAVTNPPDPVVDRIIVANLVPRVATLSELQYVLTETHDERATVLQSAEIGRDLVALGERGSKVVIWGPDRWNVNMIFWLAQSGVVGELDYLETAYGGTPVSPNEVPQPNIVNLLPQDATIAEKMGVAQAIFPAREIYLQSADDAVTLIEHGLPNSYVKVWSPGRWAGDILAWLDDQNIPYQVFNLP